MNKFTTMARLVSHIGDQLISSSTVALMELIKNSYDATIASGKEKGYIKIKIDQVKRTMIIEDNGHGMTRDDILNKYLVIGTVDRLDKKDGIKKNSIDHNTTTKVPQGEKGLGRFATMKLGEQLVMLTKSNESPKGCLLGINWNQYSYDSRKKLEDVSVHLFDVHKDSLKKSGYNESFTKLKIYNLKDFCNKKDWIQRDFEEFYKKNFMKYLNPFRPRDSFKIILEVKTHNNGFIRLHPEDLDKKLLDQAPYKIKGKVTDNQLYLKYYIKNFIEEELQEVDYGWHDTDKWMQNSIDELNLMETKNDGYVGDFEFEMYMFDRKGHRLKEIQGYEKVNEIRKVLDLYCGGFMVYRDNFRVLPYAEEGDDWLSLNTNEALRKKGLKFYTIRMIGGVFLNTIKNPNLRDQTNREGFIHNKAYENLRYILLSALKTFKNIHDDEFSDIKHKGPISTDSIQQIVKPFEDNLSSIHQHIKLIDNIPIQANNEYKRYYKVIKTNFQKIEEEFDNFKMSFKELDDKIKELDDRQRMILDLAGIGLTVETVAHEMWSYIGRMTLYLKDLKKKFPNEKKDIDVLIHNTKALESVVSRLDIQTITKRRTRSKLNLLDVVKNVCESKVSIWNIDRIDNFTLVWICQEPCFIKANQGMLVQIFDNILNNSYYWLLNYKEDYPKTPLEIHVGVWADGIVEISDTGPGISDVDKKAIFEPFFTRKKKNEGRGLGLYIVQELLNFHEADIVLSNEKNSSGRYNKFILDFSKCIN